MTWSTVTLIATLLLSPANGTQARGLEAGIAQVRSGDYLAGLLTLNDALPTLEGTDLARAHAYRAEAFLELKETQRARAAVILAIGAHEPFSAEAAGYSDALRRLVSEVRGSAPAVPAAAGNTGNVHIYSPTQTVLGQGAKVNIDCNGRRMTELQNDRVVTIRADAGTHTLRIHRTDISIAVAAGADYYYRATARPFGWNIRQVDAVEATAEMEQKSVGFSEARPECRLPSKPKPRGLN
jgi:hypothetical protein